MPYTVDPFLNDNELRLRQALDPTLNTDAPEVSSPGDAIGDIAKNPSKVVTLSPAQQKYSDVLNQVPTKANYQPNTWTRVAAGLVGLGTGLREPAKGFEAAQQIRDDSFKEALGGWERKAQASGLQAGIEEKSLAQDIANRRALALEERATAAERTASANEHWRKTQEGAELNRYHSDYEFAQKDPEGYKRYIETKNSTKQPRAETEIEFAQRDPKGYADYRNARKNNTSVTFDQWKQRADYKNKLDMTRDQARPRTVHEPSPKDQAMAEAVALPQLLRAHSEHEQFVHRATNSRGQEVITIKHPNELPNDPLVRDKYNQFLSDLNKQKKSILGKASWNITEAEPDTEPDEDEDDQGGQ